MRHPAQPLVEDGVGKRGRDFATKPRNPGEEGGVPMVLRGAQMNTKDIVIILRENNPLKAMETFDERGSDAIVREEPQRAAMVAIKHVLKFTRCSLVRVKSYAKGIRGYAKPSFILLFISETPLGCLPPLSTPPSCRTALISPSSSSSPLPLRPTWSRPGCSPRPTLKIHQANQNPYPRSPCSFPAEWTGSKGPRPGCRRS